VHVATSHSGEKLAVKVQHAGLRDTCSADVATIQALVQAAKRIFPVSAPPVAAPAAA
jgi:aarF domain-containing kinase